MFLSLRIKHRIFAPFTGNLRRSLVIKNDLHICIKKDGLFFPESSFVLLKHLELFKDVYIPKFLVVHIILNAYSKYFDLCQGQILRTIHFRLKSFPKATHRYYNSFGTILKKYLGMKECEYHDDLTLYFSLTNSPFFKRFNLSVDVEISLSRIAPWLGIWLANEPA